ncbi:hypothetical protein D3C86_1392500 [compost metagenome]
MFRLHREQARSHRDQCVLIFIYQEICHALLDIRSGPGREPGYCSRRNPRPTASQRPGAGGLRVRLRHRRTRQSAQRHRRETAVQPSLQRTAPARPARQQSGVAQQRHLLFPRLARSAQRTDGAGRTGRARSLLQLSTGGHAHRQPRLHRHPRHGGAGGALPDCRAGLEGASAIGFQRGDSLTEPAGLPVGTDRGQGRSGSERRRASAEGLRLATAVQSQWQRAP